MDEQRQHVSDAAYVVYCKTVGNLAIDRERFEALHAHTRTMLVTVDEWDAREAKLAERDAEIARLRSLVVDPPFMAEFDATIERLRDERNAELKNCIGIDELIAEHEKDPQRKLLLDEARAKLKHELAESRKEVMPNGQRCNAEVHDVTGAAHPTHAALTMLPAYDHRLGRGE